MTDTLILGGGLAGCAAALWLADHGHSTTIVEARPRLGGRAHTRDWGNSGSAVEYGGGWIRADHTLMRDLAQRLNVTLTPRATITAHTHFRDGTFSTAPADDMAEYQTALAILTHDAAKMDGDGPDAHLIRTMTLQAYMDHRALPAALRREVLAWWSISGSGAPDQIAATEYITPKLARGLLIKLEELAFTVEPGVTTLARRAAKVSGATVILADPVERLDDTGAAVRATLASGRVVQAATALVAVPVNTLAQIRFSPALNPAQQAIRRTGHAGRALKMLIRAKGPQPGSLATGETAGLRWIYADRLLPDGFTLLVAFGLYDDTGEPGHARVAAALQAAFPGAVLQDYDWHDWCADPFARGTWVSPPLDTMAHYAPDHWAPRGRLAFAGSDLYSDEQGWFEGALLTARAAATALHESLSAHENR